jgi:hypothetical protein
MERVGAVAVLLFLFDAAPLPAAPARGGAGCTAGEIAAGSCLEFDPWTGGSLVQAFDLASRKLSGSCCRGILEDFRGPDGRTLEEALASVALDPAASLARLRFVSGNGSRACDGATMAWTHPGSSRVFICTAAFSDVAHHHVGYAAVIILHEWLHTLGLLENPPSSAEITSDVARRCGRLRGPAPCASSRAEPTARLRR